MILDEDREQVKVLGRLPSLAAIAELKGVDLDPAEKARIEAAVAPRYASQVEPLVPGIMEEINDLILTQWDQGAYDLIDEHGQTVQRGMSDYPKGELQMQGMFRCFGTPYEVSFVFNSSAYPTLQASLERIALLKAQMRDGVFEMIQGIQSDPGGIATGSRQDRWRSLFRGGLRRRCGEEPRPFRGHRH